VNNNEVDKWDELEYQEMVKQPYENCCISAGFVFNHPVDTLYFKMLRGEEDFTIVLRPDEAAALAWCLTGVLWSDAMRALTENEEQ